MRRGWYWIFFRPCRMTWSRWLKLAIARLASTPRSYAQAYGVTCREIRTTRRKSDYLKPSLQKVQFDARRKDA